MKIISNYNKITKTFLNGFKIKKMFRKVTFVSKDKIVKKCDILSIV